MVYSKYSARRTWAALLGMVVALTALRWFAAHTYVNPSIVYGIGTLIVIGAIYGTMRGL